MKTLIKTFLFSLFLTSFLTCNIKEACEINNTGEICVTNEMDFKIEVFVQESKIMEVDAGKTNCVVYDVGNYAVRCFSSTHEWVFEDVTVLQCEKSQISVSEIIWED